MKKSLKPNISPLETEIEFKTSLAYLLSVVYKVQNRDKGKIYQTIFNWKSPFKEINQNFNNKSELK